MENVIYALIPITALAIPIVAILASPLKRLIALQERKVELAATTAGEAAAQYAAKIERLDARIQVLERIATDKGTALSAEIENLRLPPLN